MPATSTLSSRYATRMAAFPARDRAAFDAHWATKILGNPAAVKQTILLDGQVAGNIGSWPQDGVSLVGYCPAGGNVLGGSFT